MSDYVDYLTFLCAQEDGTVVEDADNDWTVLRKGRWHVFGTTWDMLPSELAVCGPFKLVSLPVKEATS